MINGSFFRSTPSKIHLREFNCPMVLLPVLNPAWFGLRTGSIAGLMRLSSMRLNIFVAIDSRAIPLYFVIRLRLPFFGIGMILFVVYWHGGSDQLRMPEQALSRMFSRKFNPYLSSSFVTMSSIPGALLFLNCFVASFISLIVNGLVLISRVTLVGLGFRFTRLIELYLLKSFGLGRFGI